MKKTIVLLMAGLVATAYGVVNINWTASAGFYFDANPSAGILSGGGSTIANLMYSPDGVMDNILPSMAGDVNDVVWDTVTLTEGANSEWATFNPINYTAAWNPSYSSGYVYALIFQDNTPQIYDWHYYTPLLALSDITGLLLPQTIEMNTDLTNGNAIDDFSSNCTQNVPEPATFLLFGMGGMGAWLLRRNKLKAQEDQDADA